MLQKKDFIKQTRCRASIWYKVSQEGEVSPELAHLIGVELAERLLRGRFEVVITTHLNTSHFHNHLVWNSVLWKMGISIIAMNKVIIWRFERSLMNFAEKYGLSVIRTNQKKGIHYAQWKAEKEGKPTWRTAIRSDIREAVKASYSWTQFCKRN